jgi:uncharacterized protein
MRDYELSVITLLQRGVGLEQFSFTSTMHGIEVTSSHVDPTEPIEVSGKVEATGEGLLVSIQVATTWRGDCVRCLAPASGELVTSARELYVEGPTTDDVYGFHGDVLDLSELVHDLLVLELPVLPLCRDDCRGLCARCGADLNEGPCGCEVQVGPSPFDVLDQLQGPRSEAGGSR